MSGVVYNSDSVLFTTSIEPNDHPMFLPPTNQQKQRGTASTFTAVVLRNLFRATSPLLYDVPVVLVLVTGFPAMPVEVPEL